MSSLIDDFRPSMSIIVACDSQGGIARDGKIPWYLRKDTKYFHDVTFTSTETANTYKSNVVIMGLNTWLSIPEIYKPLSGRINVILTSKQFPSLGLPPVDSTKDIGKQYIHQLESIGTFKHVAEDVYMCGSLDGAIMALLEKSNVRHISGIFICGGERLYREAYMHPLITTMYINHIDYNYQCDKFFTLVHDKQWHTISTEVITDEDMFSKMHVSMRITKVQRRHNKNEQLYLDLLSKLHSKYLKGDIKQNRTNTPTVSTFAKTLKFNLYDGTQRRVWPLLTTKRMPPRVIYEELLWFLRGDTSTQYLTEKNISIWNGNSSRGFLDSVGLNTYPVGEVGPVYGHQWRHFNQEYPLGVPLDANAKIDKTVTVSATSDQIADLIHQIKVNPTSRRLVVSAWNPLQIKQMALPPCHILQVWHVGFENNTPKFLSMHLTMRSGDIFLGVPFNIASYSALLHMIAEVCHLRAKTLKITIVDCHLYTSHMDSAETQLKNSPIGFPTLEFSDKINELSACNTLSIDDFKSGDVCATGYYSHPVISAPMVV